MIFIVRAYDTTAGTSVTMIFIVRAYDTSAGTSTTMIFIVRACDHHGRDICNDVKHRYKPQTSQTSDLD
ncbi:hypothetical protein AB4Z22_06605 [Paenibacillus sp. TAF58]